MMGTLIMLPSRGPRLETPLRKPPTLDQLKAAVGGGAVEIVPGFDTIANEGKVVRCVAFCDNASKARNDPINRDATILWDTALVRAGYPGLLKPDGRIRDMLFGKVAVVFGDAEFMSARS
jgi:hypothetical protein